MRHHTEKKAGNPDRYQGRRDGHRKGERIRCREGWQEFYSEIHGKTKEEARKCVREFYRSIL